MRKYILAIVGIFVVGNAYLRGDMWSAGFLTGLIAALIMLQLIERYMGTEQIYRRWYLMCRNELERIDPDNKVLVEIGPRHSKRESWER